MRIATLILGAAFTALVAGSAVAQTTYVATLNAAQEVPTNASSATGSATVVLNAAQTQLSVSVNFSGLLGTYTASHIHGLAAPGTNAGVVWGFVGTPAGWVFTNGNHDGTLVNFLVTGITPTNVSNLDAGLYYVNIHSNLYPGGEIRGQLGKAIAVPTRPTTWGRIKGLYR